MAKSSEEAAKLVLLAVGKIISYKATARFMMKNSSSKSGHELSLRQYVILFAIGYNNINTTTNIAKIQGQTVSSLSTIISKMEQCGYIKKEYPKNDEDGRAVYLSLTEKGHDTLEEFTLGFLKELDQFIMSLGGKERELFDKAYHKLATFVKDANNINLVLSGYAGSELSTEILKYIIAAINWAADNYLREFNKNGKKDRPLTMNQFHILCNIKYAGCSNIQELADITQVGQSSMSTAIKNLTTAGYLCKERPKPDDDGRKIYFYITKKGESALDTTLDYMYEIFKGHYNMLTDTEKDDICEGISDIYSLFSVI